MIGPLCYIGGKRRVARQIAQLFPEHTTFVEPFAGGAQVLFHKSPSRVEVINDLDGELINFFRICQHHSAELVRYLAFAVASRQLHQWYSQQNPLALTDVQRAARFLYLQSNSYGGLVRHHTFHYAVVKPANFNPRRLPAVIEATAERLARVQLESLPYQDILAKYDRSTTLFYLDPPYIGRHLYRFNLEDEEFEPMASQLSRVEGKFILSINDCPLSRSVFRQFYCREIRFAYTAARTVPIVQELLFSNYILPAAA